MVLLLAQIVGTTGSKDMLSILRSKQIGSWDGSELSRDDSPKERLLWMRLFWTEHGELLFRCSSVSSACLFVLST